jgi:hypothetical protein
MRSRAKRSGLSTTIVRDLWREQAQRLALLAPQPVAAARRPWWRRLRMTG